jgi:hypothetical protein
MTSSARTSFSGVKLSLVLFFLAIIYSNTKYIGMNKS